MYNIEKAKNISPSPKGLMGFISLGGYIFVWGPPKPMPGINAPTHRH